MDIYVSNTWTKMDDTKEKNMGIYTRFAIDAADLMGIHKNDWGLLRILMNSWIYACNAN